MKTLRVLATLWMVGSGSISSAELLPQTPASAPNLPAGPTPGPTLLPMSTPPLAAPPPPTAPASVPPQPKPVPTVAPPPKAPAMPFVSGPVDLQRFDGAIFQIAVWHSGSDVPQVVTLEKKTKRSQVLVAGIEPATIVLRFHPAAAGKAMAVTAPDGVVLHPSERVVQIGATGECVLLAQLGVAQKQADISFYIEGLTINLRLVRVLPSTLARFEKEQSK